MNEISTPICFNCSHWSISEERDGLLRAPCHLKANVFEACGCVSSYEWTQATDTCPRHKWIAPRNPCVGATPPHCECKGNRRCIP